MRPMRGSHTLQSWHRHASVCYRRHSSLVRTLAPCFLVLIGSVYLLTALLATSPHDVYSWRPYLHLWAVRPQPSRPLSVHNISEAALSRTFFLHSRIPLPNRYGNDVRLCQVLRELKKQSVKVDYYGWRATNDDTADALDELHSLVLGSVQVPLDVEDGSTISKHQHTISLQHLICQQQYQLYVIYVWLVPPSYLQYMLEFVSLLKQLQPRSQLVLLTDDVHHQRQLQIDCGAAARRSCHSRTAELMKSAELGILQMADVIVTVTEEDATTLRELLPSKQVEVIHMASSEQSISHVRSQSVSLSGRVNLLFIGADNTANDAALQWFCQAILHLVQQSLPDVKLHIVGTVNTAACCNLSNVVCHGQVGDLRTHLQHARVFVAPIVAGTGINTKNILALESGIPLITTTVGSRSLHLEQTPRAAITADTEVDFASAVVKLYNDDELWAAISRAGRLHAAQYFSVATLEQDISRVLPILRSVTSMPADNYQCQIVDSIEQLQQLAG